MRWYELPGLISWSGGRKYGQVVWLGKLPTAISSTCWPVPPVPAKFRFKWPVSLQDVSELKGECHEALTSGLPKISFHFSR
jgi:hypothetical protein